MTCTALDDAAACLSCDRGEWAGFYTITDAGSLRTLSGFTSITGDLLVRDTALEDLAGLECLTSVGWDLRIQGTNSLTSLTGLEALTSVESLTLRYNESLTTLDGLDALYGVFDEVKIRSNDSLPDCEACDLLGQLTSGPSTIDIQLNLDDECTPVTLEDCQ